MDDGTDELRQFGWWNRKNVRKRMIRIRLTE